MMVSLPAAAPAQALGEYGGITSLMTSLETASHRAIVWSADHWLALAAGALVLFLLFGMTGGGARRRG